MPLKKMAPSIGPVRSMLCRSPSRASLPRRWRQAGKVKSVSYLCSITQGTGSKMVGLILGAGVLHDFQKPFLGCLSRDGDVGSPSIRNPFPLAALEIMQNVCQFQKYIISIIITIR